MLRALVFVFVFVFLFVFVFVFVDLYSASTVELASVPADWSQAVSAQGQVTLPTLTTITLVSYLCDCVMSIPILVSSFNIEFAVIF